MATTPILFKMDEAGQIPKSRKSSLKPIVSFSYGLHRVSLSSTLSPSSKVVIQVGNLVQGILLQ